MEIELWELEGQSTFPVLDKDDHSKVLGYIAIPLDAYSGDGKVDMSKVIRVPVETFE